MTDITFIAEIGNNHNGSLERAIRLIDAAKNIGCTVAKFQLRNFASLYRGQGDLVEDLGVEYTKDLLRKYELSREDHVKLQIYCKSIGIEYMFTPWDSVSIDFLEKIAQSFVITEFQFIFALAFCSGKSNSDGIYYGFK